MKSLSKNINPTRLANYFKKEFYENRKSLLLRSVIMVAILTSIALFIGLCENEDYSRRNTALKEKNTISHEAHTTYENECYGYDYGYGYDYTLDLNYKGEYIDDASTGSLYTFISCFPIALIICASFFFESMKSKQKKIATLMAPATYLEKYLTRFAIYIILPIFVFIAGCIIAESVRFVTFSIFYPSGEIINFMDYQELINDFKSNKIALSHAITTYTLSSIAAASFYVLGSSIWPKLALLKTMAAQCIISFVALISTIIAGISGALSESTNSIKNILDSLNWEAPTYFWFIYAFLIIFSITNMVIAYYRFKESEIIQRM